MKGYAVQVGQRFAKLGEKTRSGDMQVTKWEVTSIGEGLDPIPHAKVRRLDDPLEIKIVSVPTLADPSFYRLILN